MSGFTLIELGVVLVIVGLLLGGLMLALSTQVETAKIREAERQLEEIHDALLGFAAAHGRLPCPATPTSVGNEAPVDPTTACASAHGFVPATTLGLAGARNADGLLVDPWDNPFRYSISNRIGGGGGKWDFAVPGEMRSVGLANLFPDLTICNTSASSTLSACADSNSTVVGHDGTSPTKRGVPVVFFSLGPNGDRYTMASPAQRDELENAGETSSAPFLEFAGSPSGKTYYIAGDKVFVARGRSANFDDLVSWVPPNILYDRMIAAGQLP